MPRIRSLFPAVGPCVGIAAVLAMGMTLAAQDQEDPKAAPQKPSAKVAPKDSTEGGPERNEPGREQPPTTNPRQPNAANANQDNSNEANVDPNNQTNEVLGAEFDAQGNPQGNQGLHVKAIDQSGVLARGGLKQNDKIISIEGRTFTNPNQLEAFVWSQGGRQIPVIIERGGKRYTIQVVVPQQRANSGWLGVNLDEGDADAQGAADVKGARVTQVYPSGPAARAGLQAGDVITQISQQPVEGAHDAVMLIRKLQPQAQVELAVLRDKEELKIPVVLGSRGNFQYQAFYAGQQQFQQGQQPGQGQFVQNQGDQERDQFGNVPPHAMQLEHERRMAEQHERIEDELRMLREEIKSLRQILEKK